MKAPWANLSKSRPFTLAFIFAAFSLACLAQQPAATSVPHLVSFGGSVAGSVGSSHVGTAGLTFALYREQEGGAPMWIETQNVHLDAQGRYSVQLGATKSEGVPLDLFASGEARWLGIRVNGQAELHRVMLVSVAYALKAADADTIGGRPASAFVLAPASGGIAGASSSAPTALPPAISGSGTANFVPLWTPDGNTLGSSFLFQTGSGSTAKLGINTTTPSNTLDVRGSAAIRGLLNLPASGVATASTGKNSQSQNFIASAFSTSTASAVNQAFRLLAEPAGNNTANPSANLSLLFGRGGATPAETGLRIASNGQITFASGQTFPGTGPGTVKSVALTAPASDFKVSGSPVTGSGSLGLAWKIPPTDAGTANAIVKRDGTGSFNANNITISGTFSSTSANPFGLLVNNSSTTGAAIEANSTATTGSAIGLYATTVSPADLSVAVYGQALGTNGATQGVTGVSVSPYGSGVLGRGAQTTSTFNSLFGRTGTSSGVWSDHPNIGLLATSDSGFAVLAINKSETEALRAENRSDTNGIAVTALSYSLRETMLVENLSSDLGAALVFRATGSTGQNCRTDNIGDMACTGTITANAGKSKIDHPLDPANKFLSHAAIESSEDLRLYTGNVQLDAQGQAVVQLPSWFDAVNTDFRYQLTAVGAPGPGLYVAEKIQSNRFRIAGGAPNAEVSWQVTCLRNDPYAKAHPLVVEQAKPAADVGYYEHPELYGQPTEKGIFSPQHSPSPGKPRTAFAYR